MDLDRIFQPRLKNWWQCLNCHLFSAFSHHLDHHKIFLKYIGKISKNLEEIMTKSSINLNKQQQKTKSKDKKQLWTVLQILWSHLHMLLVSGKVCYCRVVNTFHSLDHQYSFHICTWRSPKNLHVIWYQWYHSKIRHTHISFHWHTN